MEYNTQQRKQLLELFQKHIGQQLSPEDILRGLPPDSRISRSAVYRNLARMTADGLLEKTAPAQGRTALYTYTGREKSCPRVHLRCEQCGKVFHMDSEADEQRLGELLTQSGLQLDGSATVIRGVCSECKH